MVKQKSDLKVSDIAKKTKGYKERLVFTGGGLSIDAEIRYERINAKKILAERFEVIRKSPNGEVCKGSYVDSQDREVRPRSLIYLTEKGKEIDKKETQEFMIDKVKGTEQAIEKTRFLKYVKSVPKEVMDNWLIENEFEIWSETNSYGLLEIAKHLDKSKEVAVFRFSNGTIYNAFVYPVWVNGSKFIFLMSVCRIKKLENLSNVMEIAQANQVKKLSMATMVEEV